MLYLLIFIIIFILFLIIKTIFFKPVRETIVKKEIKIDNEKVKKELSEFIKFKTISSSNDSIDVNEFKQAFLKLKAMFPVVFKMTENFQNDDLLLYFKLKGQSNLKPTVLMAHYDVVPSGDGWTFDPFGGEITEEYIVGRGALDTKCTLIASLSALEEKLKIGYVPANDIYLLFGSNEEVFGDSQKNMVAELKAKNVHPYLVLDEGGGIIKNAFPFVKEKIAVIALVEKGMVNIELKVKGNPGHSSTPPKETPITIISKAIVKLNKHPMKARYCRTSLKMIDTLGRHMPFLIKIVFANMWLFKGILKKVFTKISRDTLAIVNSTFAFTIINAGKISNVLPDECSCTINVRINPVDTVDDVINHIRKVVNDERVTISLSNASRQYKECDFNNPAYSIVTDTIKETYDGVISTPFVMIGGTDGRHYNEISDMVVRFSPIDITNEERKGIHGYDEKIKISTLEKCREFYFRLYDKI